jgi:hypothetical protein
MKINKSNLPADPTRFYNCSWGELLGNGCRSHHKGGWMPFEEARKFVHKLKLKGYKEWRIYCKSGNKPENIPSNPDNFYKNEWISWGDFLGTGNVHKKDFLPFEEARKFVQKLKLKNVIEWQDYCKNKPENIPSNPDQVYKNEWKGYPDFLGYV